MRPVGDSKAAGEFRGEYGKGVFGIAELAGESRKAGGTVDVVRGENPSGGYHPSSDDFQGRFDGAPGLGACPFCRPLENHLQSFSELLAVFG